MKALVITDIHGSSKYLKLALDKYEKLNCTKMIILGDILYHGPRNDLPEDYEPKVVMKLLNERKDKIIAIKGNCDAEVDEMVLEFPLFREAIIKSGKEILLTHGHHLDEVDYDGYIMYGHYHVTKFEDNLLGIGSLSIPKDGIYTYAVLEDGKLEVFDLLNDKKVNEIVL